MEQIDPIADHPNTLYLLIPGNKSGYPPPAVNADQHDRERTQTQTYFPIDKPPLVAVVKEDQHDQQMQERETEDPGPLLFQPVDRCVLPDIQTGQNGAGAEGMKGEDPVLGALGVNVDRDKRDTNDHRNKEDPELRRRKEQ